MPEGLRNGTVAVGLAVLILVTAWSVFVWHLGTYQERHRKSDQQQAYADTGPTDSELYDLCLSGSPTATVECIREYVETSRDAQRAEKDLKAQQQMADWTLLMTWASGAGVLVTAIGVIYVAATLAQTRRATNAAIQAARAADNTVEVTSKIGKRQIRAYVLPSTADMIFTEDMEPVAHINIKNFGQTPAHHVKIWTHTWIEVFPFDGPLPEPPFDFAMSDGVLGPGFHSEAEQPNGVPLNDETLRLIANERAAIYVYGQVTYDDAFGAPHSTKFKFFYNGPTPIGEVLRLQTYMSGNEAD